MTIEKARTQASARIAGDFMFIEDSSNANNNYILCYVRSAEGSNENKREVARLATGTRQMGQ
jgi:hypothetical protein